MGMAFAFAGAMCTGYASKNEADFPVTLYTIRVPHDKEGEHSLKSSKSEAACQDLSCV